MIPTREQINSRITGILYAFCTDDESLISEPQSLNEILLLDIYNKITTDVKFEDCTNRISQLLWCINVGSIDLAPMPISDTEKLLYGILTGDKTYNSNSNSQIGTLLTYALLNDLFDGEDMDDLSNKLLDELDDILLTENGLPLLTE